MCLLSGSVSLLPHISQMNTWSQQKASKTTGLKNIRNLISSSFSLISYLSEWISLSLKSKTARTMVGGPKTFWEDQRAKGLRKGCQGRNSRYFCVFLFLRSEDQNWFQGLGVDLSEYNWTYFAADLSELNCGFDLRHDERHPRQQVWNTSITSNTSNTSITSITSNTSIASNKSNTCNTSDTNNSRNTNNMCDMYKWLKVKKVVLVLQVMQD